MTILWLVKRGTVCLDLCTKPVSFITHLLNLCGLKMNNFKSFTISQRDVEHFCHSLKGNLEEQYVGFWKDQIQQHGNQGKLRTFKKFRINWNFEFCNHLAKCYYQMLNNVNVKC